MNLSILPDLRASADPLGPAIADDTTDFNNAGFLDAVQCAGAMLRGRGVAVGDSVAVMVPNTAAFVVSLFAAWRLGAAVAAVDPSLRPAQVRDQLSDAGAKVLIAETAPQFDIRPVEVVTVAELACGDPGFDIAPHQHGRDRLALLIYTNGSEGRPKGMMFDHANLDAMCRSVIDAFGLTGADHSLLIVPLFQLNGIVVGTLSPLLAGGRVTAAGQFDAKTFFGRLEQTRATYFSAVPTIYTVLCELPDNVQPDTSWVRFAICGASPASADVLKRFESRYHIPIIGEHDLLQGSCESTINPLGC
jgi:long-chain acyl-CoA synthetase